MDVLDQDFQLGISNAVNVCMKIQSSDRVYIVADETSYPIGRSLEKESNLNGASSRLVKLEDFGSRPMSTFSENQLLDLVEFKPSVTFFIASGKEGEFKMRKEMIKNTRSEFSKLGIELPRHAHMPNIDPKVMREGMRADYHQINRITLYIYEIVRKASEIHFTSEKGSNMTATFNTEHQWVACHGLYHEPGMSGNLPEGEVFTCPECVDGIIVADVLGDYFDGILDEPVIFKVENGMTTDIVCKDNVLKHELYKYIFDNENGSRVGEFAIGTNIGLNELTGNIGLDEKIPGVHIAFGNPHGLRTGAEWSSDVHLDVVPTCCTIEVDGKVIMNKGKFTLDLGG